MWDAAATRLDNLWAPELYEHDGTWYLYYSVSTFGSGDSVIALATNATLDPAAPDYEWVDQGEVIASEGTDFNAIDAGIVEDADGTPWMSFGSFSSGIRMVELEWAGRRPPGPDAPLTRPWHDPDSALAGREWPHPEAGGGHLRHPNGRANVQKNSAQLDHRPRQGRQQLYGRDLVASVTRPVAQLLGYARIELEPGQSRRVVFDVPAARFAFSDRSLTRVVEPGEVRVWAGSHAEAAATASGIGEVTGGAISNTAERADRALPGVATPAATVVLTGDVHAVTAEDERLVRATWG